MRRPYVRPEVRSRSINAEELQNFLALSRDNSELLLDAEAWARQFLGSRDIPTKPRPPRWAER